MEENWVVLCQAFYQAVAEGEWRDMHEQPKEVSKNIDVQQSGYKVSDLGNLAYRKEGGEVQA